METEFFRKPTEPERRNFVNINIESENVSEIFRKKIDEEQKKHSETFKPFCARCARFDFQDLLKQAITEAERTRGYADFRDLKVNLPDLAPYGEDSRFTFLKEQKAMEPVGKLEAGKVQRQIQIGVHKDYKCNVRNCGISVFVPKE